MTNENTNVNIKSQFSYFKTAKQCADPHFGAKSYSWIENFDLVYTLTYSDPLFAYFTLMFFVYFTKRSNLVYFTISPKALTVSISLNIPCLKNAALLLISIFPFGA